MTTLTTAKNNNRSKRKQSRFQKLSEKADRLKRQNEKLKSRLEELLEIAEQEIRPVEKQAAEAELPLLRKLLTLGQENKWDQVLRCNISDGLVRPCVAARPDNHLDIGSTSRPINIG